MNKNDAYLGTRLWVPKHLINLDGTKRALTFSYVDKDRKNVDLELFQESEDHLGVPREFWKAGQLGLNPIDCRPSTYQRTRITSRIKLDHLFRDGQLIPTGRTIQQESVDKLLASSGGILQLACGCGKTTIALEIITRAQVPTLIVVDNLQLLHQWTEAIKLFLDVPGGLGIIEGAKNDWKKNVVLSTFQTLFRRAKELPEEVRRWFGLAFYDEAHHVNAPMYSLCADLIYGRRFGLSATPKREDGSHIIAEFHFGPVLYKNLKQELRPRIYFVWTGLTADTRDPGIASEVCDARGELSLPKLACYFGRHLGRLNFILEQVRKALEEKRKVLVLSNSVEELVNLLALWNGEEHLYSDIPVPTPEEVGGHAQPKALDTEDLDAEIALNDRVGASLADPQTDPRRRVELKMLLNRSDERLLRHMTAVKINRVLDRKQTEYIQRVLRTPSNAGLMVYKVKPAARSKMLKEKDVTFAIMKYGREGLDDKNLDTVLVSSQFSAQGGTQQVMGRVLREGDEIGKSPMFIVLEDNVLPVIKMCRKMRKHLRHWPVEDGGPYSYEFVGYPPEARRVR